MTPDDGRNTDRIDGLLASFGELMKADAVLEQRVGDHDKAFVEMREAIRDAIKAMHETMKEVGETCAANTRRVEAKIDKEFADQKAEADARKLTRWQKITISVAIAGVLASPIMLVLGVGGPG